MRYSIGQMVMFKEVATRTKRIGRPKNGFYVILKFIGTDLLICLLEDSKKDIIAFSMEDKKYIVEKVNRRSIHLYPSALNFAHKINDSFIPKL